MTKTISATAIVIQYQGTKMGSDPHLISVMNGTYSGIVDWCCGKGHLGRTLSHVFDVPLQGLDIDEELIIQAREVSESRSQHQFTKCDVLKEGEFP